MDAPAQLIMVNIDCAQPRQLVAFYSSLLGWQVDHDEDAYGMISKDGTAIGFGQVESFSPPHWPDETGAKQFHLDLGVPDVAAAEQRSIELGATVPEFQPGETWRVLIDPAGHPFCLVARN